MIRNYLRSAWRNIARHKFISFINIFGLTVGLTCCLLIITYLINELSYDRYNVNADRTYRVTRIFYSRNGEENLHLSAVAPPFGPLLKTAFPDIEKVTRVLPNGTTVLKYKEKLFNEQNGFFADENFFNIFSANVIEGDKKKALYDPYNIMLTPEVAKKYFGNDNPINKTITTIVYGFKHEYKVTGIFEPFPANAHMHPDILMSFNTLKDSAIYGEKQLETNFGNNSFYTYLLMPKGYNMDIITRQFDAFVDKYYNPKGLPPGIKPHQTTKLTIQKLTDIHLQSHLDDEIEPNGDMKRVYIFSIIALFILLIACINYMNLSTARSALRAKEIGIRKVLGASISNIVTLLTKELILLVLIATVIATPVAWWAMNKWLQSFAYRIHISWWIFIIAGAAAILIALITISFQSIKAATANPVNSLRSE